METYFSSSTGNTINYNIVQSAFILLPSVSSQSNLITEKSIMMPSNIVSQKKDEEYDLLSTASHLNEEVEIMFRVVQGVRPAHKLNLCRPVKQQSTSTENYSGKNVHFAVAPIVTHGLMQNFCRKLVFFCFSMPLL